MNTKADDMLDDLRMVLDELDEANRVLSILKKRKAELETDIKRYAEQVGVTDFGNERLSVRVKAELQPTYDPAHWPDIVRWAVESGNDHIVQRRLSGNKVRELMDNGVAFPEGLGLEEVVKVSTTRRN